MSTKRNSGIAARLSQWLWLAWSAYSSWNSIIGSIVACIAVCNLIFRLFSVSVFEALSWFLKAYQQTFHPPVAFLFSWLPFALPSAAKDVMLLYMALAGVLYRSLSSYAPGPALRSPFPFSWRTTFLSTRVRVSHIVAALMWPFFIVRPLQRPFVLVKGAHGSHGRLPHMERKAADALLARQHGGPVVFCDERELIVSYFVTLVIAVLGLVALNAAVNELTARLR